MGLLKSPAGTLRPCSLPAREQGLAAPASWEGCVGRGRSDEWKPTIDTVVTQLASVKPSLAPGRLRVLVNSIGECAKAFSSGDVDWLNETIEQATAAIGQRHCDDQQLHLFE